MLLSRKDAAKPRHGDTVVTLQCDGTLPLEERMELLSYAFAKAVQGATLRRVTKWDLRNGEIQFIVGDGPAVPPVTGKLITVLEDWPTPGVRATEQPRKL